MNLGDNTDPVFKTVGQALYLAFVMEVTPASTPSPTETLIRDLMKQRYGEAPVPQAERSINMGGMNPQELRAQCALIRASVNDHLRSHERDAICARFGHQTTRSNAVRGLRDHYGMLCNSQHQEAILGLIWAIYVPGIRQFPGESPRAFNLRRKKRENEWSVRGLEKTYGVSKSVLHRDQQMLRKLLHGVEMQAQTHMEELFTRTRLIADPDA
jgi:hypothetical protein